MTSSTKEYEFSGDYELLNCILTTRAGEDIDIKPLFMEIDIFEDFFASSISVDVALLDGVNILKNLDIAGGENLHLEFVTAGMDRGVDLNLSLYKVSEKIKQNANSDMVILHFCPKERILNHLINISQSYNGMISEIIPKILKDHLKSDRPLTLDETAELRNVVVPRWKPFKLINWLTKRASSSEYEGSSFFFYDTVDGYNLRSLESLVDPDKAENESRRTITHTTSNISTDITEKELEAWSNAIKLQVLSNTDILSQIDSGMFAAQLETFDVRTRKRNIDDMQYRRDFGKYKHLEKGNTFLIGGGQDYDDYPSAKHVYSNMMSEAWENNSGNHVRFYDLPRKMLQAGISSILVNLMLWGDSSLRVGEKVDLHILSNEEIDEENWKDSKLSGKYLITAIRHIIKREAYTMSVECSKDTWGTPLKS